MITANTAPKGSVLGSILLIGGSCIGAGMLGLPIPSAMAGFIPSSLMFAISCLFMIVTGLLLLETAIAFEGDVNLITMADKTLGKGAKSVVFCLFGFLFYSILVAYSSGSGALFSDFCEWFFEFRPPEWVGSGLFNIVFGCFVFLGTKASDNFNRLLMLGLIISYLMLVYMGLPSVNHENLMIMNWKNALWTLPVLIISFGYHNLVPSIASYLGKDAKRIIFSIFIGCLIPLFVYVLWDFLILGIIPPSEFKEISQSGSMITHAFRESAKNAPVATVTEFFAFFAIITSFIGVALSFVDFLTDAMSLKKKKRNRFLMTLLALIPPYVFSIYYPGIFLIALDAAGGFGAVILFGIIPALMVWSGRYKRKLWNRRLLPFGRAGLILVILFSLLVFAVEFALAFGRIQ